MNLLPFKLWNLTVLTKWRELLQCIFTFMSPAVEKSLSALMSGSGFLEGNRTPRNYHKVGLGCVMLQLYQVRSCMSMADHCSAQHKPAWLTAYSPQYTYFFCKGNYLIIRSETFANAAFVNIKMLTVRR